MVMPVVRHPGAVWGEGSNGLLPTFGGGLPADPIARLRAAGLIRVPSAAGSSVTSAEDRGDNRPRSQPAAASSPRYSPKDVLEAQQQMAEYFQSRPIAPMYGGTTASGWAATGANFLNPFMGSYLNMQGIRSREENERIRREASDTASRATSLPDAVRALQGGTPEQSNTALQMHLQNLAKEQERQRQTADMALVYGAPSGAPTAAQPQPQATQPAPEAPAPAPAPTPSAAPNQLRTAWPFPTDAPPAASAPAAVDTGSMMPPQGEAPPPPRPQHTFTIDGATPQQMAQLPANQPEPRLTRGLPPQAAPGQQSALPEQPDPLVQIGQFRLPLSEARRRAALGRARGIDVKPLEDAIQLAEEPLRAQARERGKALGEGQNGLPQALQSVESTIGKIDEIATDPQLSRIIGWSSYNPLSYAPYTAEQKGLVSRIQQVQGRFFLQAFDALRGTGQISNQEGEKAQAAIARIQEVGQDIGSYMTALEDARREVWSLANTARQRAGLPPVPYQPAPPPVGAVRDGYRFNGGDPSSPRSWQRVQ